jgi:protein-L-isoaspartate(D-aspartate) O-methyltransferase
MDEAQRAEEERFVEARRLMLIEQLVGRGIRDPRVLTAMGEVPRHRFVESALVYAAYEDRPLTIGFDQTISQPYMVARATELATPQPADRALEVGAGCGYQTAVLARLVAQVYAIELVPALAARAARTLAETGCRNATVACFDGSGGWPAHAPYDVIIVSAGAPRVPPLLVDQLADGGRLVVPVGPPADQALVVVRRVGDSYEQRRDTACRYVDLLGRYGVGGAPPAA